jgi:hypothetical protein
MSTKNVVGDNIVNPVTASWYYVGESKCKSAGDTKGTPKAILAWMTFQLSRLTTSLFIEDRPSAVLVPIPLRNTNRRDAPWR